MYLYELSGASSQLLQTFEHRAPVLDVCWGAREDEAYTAGLDWDIRRYTWLSSSISFPDLQSSLGFILLTPCFAQNRPQDQVTNSPLLTYRRRQIPRLLPNPQSPRFLIMELNSPRPSPVRGPEPDHEHYPSPPQALFHLRNPHQARRRHGLPRPPHLRHSFPRPRLLL